MNTGIKHSHLENALEGELLQTANDGRLDT